MVSCLLGNIPTMVVNKAMASQPMCVSRLRNMVEPLFNKPQSNPYTFETLNSTKVPPPFKVPEANEKIKEDTPTVTTNATVASKGTGNQFNDSMSNVCESGGWELVRQEPPVDIFMDEIPPIQPISSDHSVTPHSNAQPNGLLQRNTSITDAKSSSSVTTYYPDSPDVRTYTPVSISSEEEGTASEPDSETLEDSTIGLLRPRKKHAFNAPDLFRNTWKAPKKTDNADTLSVSDGNTIYCYAYLYIHRL